MTRKGRLLDEIWITGAFGIPKFLVFLKRGGRVPLFGFWFFGFCSIFIIFHLGLNLHVAI